MLMLFYIPALVFFTLLSKLLFVPSSLCSYSILQMLIRPLFEGIVLATPETARRFLLAG